MFNIAIIGQLLADQFPYPKPGWLVADWDGLPYSYYPFTQKFDMEIQDPTITDVSSQWIPPFGRNIGWMAAVYCPNMTSLNCNANTLQILKLDGSPALTSLLCTGNYLKILDLTTNTGLTYVDCYYNEPLESIFLPTSNIITHLNADLTNLSTATIDNIFISLDANGQSGGQLNVTSIRGTLRSHASDAAFANLTTKGWTILPNV